MNGRGSTASETDVIMKGSGHTRRSKRPGWRPVLVAGARTAIIQELVCPVTLMTRYYCLVVFGLSLLLAGCGPTAASRSMEVTATAYTMRESETKQGNVGLAAWGDQLKPGMKVVAVSRDLIDEGLDHETELRIEGLEGTYIVLDKMAARWERKIDIFMGHDVERAREWGKREVTIHWTDSP